jgi:hypothetical protein
MGKEINKIYEGIYFPLVEKIALLKMAYRFFW